MWRYKTAHTFGRIHTKRKRHKDLCLFMRRWRRFQCLFELRKFCSIVWECRKPDKKWCFCSTDMQSFVYHWKRLRSVLKLKDWDLHYNMVFLESYWEWRGSMKICSGWDCWRRYSAIFSKCCLSLLGFMPYMSCIASLRKRLETIMVTTHVLWGVYYFHSIKFFSPFSSDRR